ncbi:MAG: MFS transporter [Streptosporangiaceae bacterium]
MSVEPYKRVLAIPGVRALLLVGLVARIPLTASGLVLTLHVVNGQHRGFFDAGLVGAAATVGLALGAPFSGRFIDRLGLRPVLLVTTLAQLVFWVWAPFLPYPLLLPGALVGGLLGLPVFGVIRQCVAAAVPESQRRPAFALDSMGVELSYMVGPALAVAGSTALGSNTTMMLLGLGLVGSGTALLVLNPRTRTEAELEFPETVPRRQWLTVGLITVLGTATAATFVLTATELCLVALLKDRGAQGWTGLLIGIWCFYSLVGGFVYGMLPRGRSPLLLIGLLCALTAPLGLVGGPWPWLILALFPSGVMCAPGLASTIDTVSRWVPASARGEAMGLHGTALTLGVAVAGPVAGSIIDAYGTGWAFAATGMIGTALVAAAVPFWRRAPQQQAELQLQS